MSLAHPAQLVCANPPQKPCGRPPAKKSTAWARQHRHYWGGGGRSCPGRRQLLLQARACGGLHRSKRAVSVSCEPRTAAGTSVMGQPPFRFFLDHLLTRFPIPWAWGRISRACGPNARSADRRVRAWGLTPDFPLLGRARFARTRCPRSVWVGATGPHHCPRLFRFPAVWLRNRVNTEHRTSEANPTGEHSRTCGRAWCP